MPKPRKIPSAKPVEKPTPAVDAGRSVGGKFSGLPSAEHVETATTVVDAAVSVGGQVAELLPTHCQCHIEVKNSCSNYTLSNPGMYAESGSCAKSLPMNIDPSATGDVLFTKTPNTAQGAVGVFTYDLLNRSTNEATEKMAVMFSVPYDFNLYSNWYAVGVFDKSKECNHDLYYHMYNNTDSRFVRGKASGSRLSHENERVSVTASMTDSYQPVMKVEVKDK